MYVQRRDVLKTAGAFSLAALAGCTSAFGGSDVPAYSEATPRDGATDGEGVYFVHFDATWLRAFDDEAELPYEDELPDTVDVDLDPDTALVDVDPLVAYPTAGLVGGMIGLGFGLLPYGGLGEVLLEELDEPIPDDESLPDDDESPPGDPDEVDGSVRVDSILIVDGVAVFRGEFDGRELAAVPNDFEYVGERDGFEVYEGTGDDFFGWTEGRAFAVEDDVLVALLDDEASVDAVLDGIGGEVDRLSDDDDAAWALGTAGHGAVTLGAWEMEPKEPADDGQLVDVDDVVEDAVGFVSSFTLGPEEGTGSLAAVFPEGETPSRAAVGNQIGTSATERDVTIDDTRVSVTGTWRAPPADDGDGDDE